MSLPPAYTSLLNELNRDILRSAPADPLQFCASWFFHKLEQDRLTTRSLIPPNGTPSTALTTFLPSNEIYSHPTTTTTTYSAFSPVHHVTYSPVLPASFPPVHHAHPTPLPPPPPPSNHHHHHVPPQSYSNPFQPQAQYHTTTTPAAPVYQHLPSDPRYAQTPHPYEINPQAPITTNTSNTNGSHPPEPALNEEQRAYSFGRPHSTPSRNRIGPTDHHVAHPQSPSGHHHHHHHHHPSPSSHRHHPHPHPSRTPSRIVSNMIQHRSQTPTHSELSPRAAPVTTPSKLNTSHSTAPLVSRRTNKEASSGESTSEDEDGDEPPLVPSGYNFGRRTSVSAESLSPSHLNSGTQLPKVVIPKTPEQRQRIASSIKENLLFRNLDEEQYNDVLNAMSELKVGLGTEVIVQGGVGDFFYVVEEGTFDVYVRGPATYTYIPPVANAVTGTLALPTVESQQQEPILRGSTPVGGTTVTHQAPPKKVHSYGPGGSFGELALMYNAPRAATVVATSESATLWALDRVTFRSILMEHTSRKRKMYEAFLSEVPILASLTPGERAKIADSLEERTIAEGVEVVKEGEVGREFYIIESGKAEVSKVKNGSEAVVVGVLGKGDHFGELALLNSAPRAATVRAVGGRLRVGALGEKAFTRLLGPVIEILSRHAESHYGTSSVVRRPINAPSGMVANGGTGPFGHWAGISDFSSGPAGGSSSTSHSKDETA